LEGIFNGFQTKKLITCLHYKLHAPKQNILQTVYEKSCDYSLNSTKKSLPKHFFRLANLSQSQKSNHRYLRDLLFKNTASGTFTYVLSSMFLSDVFLVFLS